MRYMLDTNICIYAIKHKPEQVFIRLKEHDPQELWKDKSRLGKGGNSYWTAGYDDSWSC